MTMLNFVWRSNIGNFIINNINIPYNISNMSTPSTTNEHALSYPKHKIKILLLEKIAQSAVDAFVREGFTVETAEKLSENELIEKIKDVHALGVRSKTQVTK